LIKITAFILTALIPMCAEHEKVSLFLSGIKVKPRKKKPGRKGTKESLSPKPRGNALRKSRKHFTG
jgi:hypothetical protein